MQDFLLPKRVKKCRNISELLLCILILINRAEVKREIAELEALLAGATQVYSSLSSPLSVEATISM
jgi:hypothetical protein